MKCAVVFSVIGSHKRLVLVKQHAARPIVKVDIRILHKAGAVVRGDELQLGQVRDKKRISLGTVSLPKG